MTDEGCHPAAMTGTMMSHAQATQKVCEARGQETAPLRQFKMSIPAGEDRGNFIPGGSFAESKK